MAKAEKSAKSGKSAAAQTSKKSSARADGLHRPVQPSDDLGAIVGTKPMTRADVVSKVWDYIKANKLQDPKDGRNIKADDKLARIFGKKEATMFEMNKHLSAHLKAAT
ncbi:MAG: SWIB/MDM2 domain-containing protein [Pseudomonadota bacterium]